MKMTNMQAVAILAGVTPEQVSAVIEQLALCADDAGLTLREFVPSAPACRATVERVKAAQKQDV